MLKNEKLIRGGGMLYFGMKRYVQAAENTNMRGLVCYLHNKVAVIMTQ
jgi:hypothetical protein